MATNNSSSNNNDQNNQHGAMPQELRPYGEDTQDGGDGDARLSSGEQFGAMPAPWVSAPWVSALMPTTRPPPAWTLAATEKTTSVRPSRPNGAAATSTYG